MVKALGSCKVDMCALDETTDSPPPAPDDVAFESKRELPFAAVEAIESIFLRERPLLPPFADKTRSNPTSPGSSRGRLTDFGDVTVAGAGSAVGGSKGSG